MKLAPEASAMASSQLPPDSPVKPLVEHDKHFRDWPNAGGFNAIEERHEAIKLLITGSFPSYASGSLYRTGPGCYKLPRTNPADGEMSCDHWFDGFGTLHKFEMVPGEDGKCGQVTYQSRHMVDELMEHARKTGNLANINFGQKRDPCDTLYRKMKTLFAPSASSRIGMNNAQVVVRPALPQEKKQLGNASASRPVMTVTTDNDQAKQFDADTLEPIGLANQTTLHPKLKGQLSAAHASKDPVTGDIFNYNLQMGPVQTYKVFRASPTTGEVEILAEWTADRDVRPSYIHSLFLTDNFVILCVWASPYKGNGIKILWEQNLMDALEAFDPKVKTTWVVIDRHHGRGIVKKFKSEAMFSFHTTNAWEEKRDQEAGAVDLVCELFEHKTLDILHKFYYKNLVSDGPGVEAFDKKRSEWRRGGLARYRLSGVPLNKTSTKSPGVADKILWLDSPLAGDLQGINPKFAMKPHRYVWAPITRGKSSFMDGLCKTDTETGTALFWEQERHTPGEPIFVAAPDAKAEDEGVILTVVYNGDAGTSYLLCLDAQTMKEVGRAEVPIAVGFGFHGLHLPSSQA